MKPISYKEENGVTTFQYDQEELDKWNELGKRDGNVGVILASRTESPRMTTYYGYGTIENPSRTPMTMTTMFHPMFDNIQYGGRWLTNDEIINPPKVEEQIKCSHKLYFIGDERLEEIRPPSVEDKLTGIQMLPPHLKR